jgi:multidrug efflux pump subunit AcrB
MRAAQVRTIFPGASPERVEQLITDKLEKVIQELPEIDFLSSTSKPGVSVIIVNILEEYSEMRPIWDNLRRKVDRAARELPDGVIGPIVNDEFGDVFGTIITLTGDGFSYAQMKDVADECRSQLLLSRNIAKVEIVGVQDERVFVEYNNARLAELGLSPDQLSGILASRNIIIPGGEIYTADEQIALEPTGNFDTVDELKRTVINIPGSDRVMYLGDIVNIYRGYVDPPNSLLRFNGEPALALSLSLREGGNIIDLGDEVLAFVDQFQQSYPIGVEFDLLSFQPHFVARKITEFTRSLLQAVVIVLLVMLMFLGLRTGLVVSSLIPMAMIMALLVMSALDIGLDQMSLAALIIALGMLVDNAIVMSESILVQMRAGTDGKTAAIESARELRVPLLTSSLTTAAAFLPIYLAESSTGEYTAPLFKVVTITLLCSWLLSLTMTPLLCAQFLKVPANPTQPTYDSGFYRAYRSILQTLLRNRLLTVTGALLLLILAGWGMGFVPAIFFPDNDKPIAFAEIELPVGSPLSKSSATLAAVDRFIMDSLFADTVDGTEGVLNFASFVGSSAPRFYLSHTSKAPSPEYNYILMNGTSADDFLDRAMPALDDYLFRTFPDVTASAHLLPLGPPIEKPVQIRLTGTDSELLFEMTDLLKSRMSEMPGLRNINDDWGSRAKKLVVHVNQPRAQRAGLTSRDVAISLQTVLSGLVTTDYREDDEVIPVVLRSVAADRSDYGKLESHNIYVQATGRSVPLKQVADIEMVWQTSKIIRRDRLRTITISADVVGGANAIALAMELDPWLKQQSALWPLGYMYELGGEVEKSGQANESIMVKLPIAFLLIILLLVGQFNSIRRPVIILLTIPLGIVGVTIGLLLTGAPMGFMTFLGIISLAGIVINNAIVLLDRIRIERTEFGRSPQEAVVEAAQRRLRPILLTTATTIGGLMPLWFGGSPMYVPMAIAIIFGLAFATVLTLGLVPVLYSIFFRVSFRDPT